MAKFTKHTLEYPYDPKRWNDWITGNRDGVTVAEVEGLAIGDFHVGKSKATGQPGYVVSSISTGMSILQPIKQYKKAKLLAEMLANSVNAEPLEYPTLGTLRLNTTYVDQCKKAVTEWSELL